MAVILNLAVRAIIGTATDNRQPVISIAAKASASIPAYTAIADESISEPSCKPDVY
ncbi:hypothetical protein [Pseudomonas sp. SCT]|uniref:hypothetical protein n=1 Tax=Pseudomonas sp. (strain SCT) TaxID=412955 RepID=UPI00135BD16E|nr:hypothetical protein [Pseudomonas sp. SCT]